MSDVAPKMTVTALRRLKGRHPIVCITAYDAITTQWATSAEMDLILVGDSVGTTFLGFETTVPVTLDMMIHHCAAAARTQPRALLAVDLPFGWAQRDPDACLEGASRLMQEGGAEAVKVEGTAHEAPLISRLVRAGIPVIGHLGLLPQQYFRLGGYRKFGKTEAEAAALRDDARAIEEAGAFCLLGEMIHPPVAEEIARTVTAPFIGIGCGADVDGQILVCSDALGMRPGAILPSFAKPFAQVGQEAINGLSAYRDAVRERRFPE